MDAGRASPFDLMESRIASEETDNIVVSNFGRLDRSISLLSLSAFSRVAKTLTTTIMSNMNNAT